MRVIYFGHPFFADCDFPLVKTMQEKGIEIFYYMPLYRNLERCSILEFAKPVRGIGLIKASNLEEMQVYKDCVELDRLFFIKGYPRNKLWIPSWLLWIYVLWHMKRRNADIVHISWHFLSIFERFVFSFALGKKNVMTVHDPIMHSGQPNANYDEKMRIRSFSWADHFVLLNKIQAHSFMEKYSVTEKKITYSSLVKFDSITKIQPSDSTIIGKYIIFFGQIIPYKGLEYLLESMMSVHKCLPDLKLVVAGGGELYFDSSKYQDLDYIIWKHRYIGIRELAGLLKNSLFTVCPYKDATQSGVIQTSFSMGIPVISSNVGALSLEVKDNINGKLVPPCDVDALADAIISLSNNNCLLDEMKMNIKTAYKKDDRNQKIAEEYINMYRKILC